MTKMAAMSKYGKNLLQNHWASCFENWNVVSGVSTFVQMMTLGWPWLFYVKVIFGTLGFWIENAETVHFSVTIIICDMEMQSASTPMNAKGQGHLVTLAKGHLGWIFLKSFFLETTRQIQIIFNLKPVWDGRNKLCSNSLGHMTKMVAMPKYGKNLKNLLQKHWANCLETSKVVSSDWVLPSLFKFWPQVDLTYFMSMSNLVP